MKIESLKGEGIYFQRSYGVAMRKMGPFVFVQGLTPIDPKTGKLIRNLDDLPEEVRKQLSGGDLHTDAIQGPIVAQSWFIYQLMKNLLESVGSSLEDILQAIIFMRDMRRDWIAFNKVRQMIIKNPPPSTVVETPCLGISDDILIEMHVIAGIPDKN